jgi:hypothetical protein
MSAKDFRETSALCWTEDSPTTKLGRDSAFPSKGLGTGVWDFEAYWTANFGAKPFPVVDSKTWNKDNLPTRYQVYKYELADYDELVKKGSEIGAPMCATPETDVDRRILYAAVVDCDDEDEPVKGKWSGQAEGFVEMFLTEPATQEPGSGPETIYVEITDLVEVGSNTSVARDRVQLYR